MYARIAFTLLAGLGCALPTAMPVNAQDKAAEPWTDYFQVRVDQLANQTRDALAGVTADNWPDKKQQWRSELREMLGLPAALEKTPLEVTSVGSITLDGVTVERLHYQSRPGLYVGANLYRPASVAPESGWPAVLYVCGHARPTIHGRQIGNKTSYQHHGLWLARHGVVCLTIDTVQLGEFHGEHHGTYKLGRWDWISRGYTPAGVEAWNAIRGIDLLCDLPDVDANHIGITGRSGGGAYSWYAAALDERIQVAVPVAGITDLQNHIIDGCVEGHCDCMYFVNYHGWDYAKLAALVAPRALLLENSDTDSIFPLDGVMRIDHQLRELYARLGASNRYGLVITPGPHSDTQDLQIPAFRWLLKHLTDQTEVVIDSPALKEISPEDLAVFEKETPQDEGVTSVSAWFSPFAEVIEPPSQAALAWDRALPELTRLGVVPQSVTSGEFQLTQSLDSPSGRYDLLSSSTPAGDSTVSTISILRKNASVNSGSAPQQHPAIVHLILSSSESPLEAGMDTLVHDPQIQARVNAFPDRSLYFVFWRGTSWISQAESVKKKNQLVRRFYLLGESPESIALQDCLTAIHWITRSDTSEIELAGSGRDAPLMVMAGLWINGNAGGTLIKRLHLGETPSDALLTSSLPGMLTLVRFETLYAAAQDRFEVQPIAGTLSSGRLLVDTAAEPQQANGMRMIEPGPTGVTVWVRATRWPLANLADLGEVQFANDTGKQSSGAILPESGVDGLRFAVPGVAAEARVGYRLSGPPADWTYTAWQPVDASSDYSALIPLKDLQPASLYELRTQVRSQEGASESSLSGSFKTLPAPQAVESFRLAVGTCQAFVDRDGPHGFDLYATLLERQTDAFVMAGDVVYYDKLARSRPLAYYHWQRTYSLPTLVEFHKRVPTFFLKDDHDTYVNDSWPGEYRPWTDDFTFSDGQQIFVQETGLPSPAYRTFTVGKDLQVWLMEGRDYRSPNSLADGPEKSIWGIEQKQWLARTLDASTARFKVIISPTPIVGPDRDNKRDNHSNEVFATEGREVRRLLASHPNTISVCGDRHWQFHSVDPDTGLHEFSVGPASDRHAGGWNPSDFRRDIHQYLRVAGGYLEIELSRDGQESQLTLRHMDTRGEEHHRHVLR